jgi:hypothetical protein
MVSYLVAMRHIRHLVAAGCLPNLVAAPDVFAIWWLQDM